MAVIIIVVASGRGRGKTTLMEFLTSRLSKKMRVWTVKHVSEHLDTVEKDTWRHLKAGAEGTIAAESNRLVILKPQTQTTLENALGEVPDGVDLILVEGFRRSDYPKILVAQSETEAEEQLDKINGVIAISGPVANSRIQQSIRGVPVRSLEDLLENINYMVHENKVKPL